MASGLGPNLILPTARYWLTNLMGFDPTQLGRARPDPMGWFGPNPMEGMSNAMQRGRAGLWTSVGPQGTKYQPDYFHGGSQVPTSAGVNAALFGSSYNPAFGQSAYDRFADAGDSYLRRFGTNLVVKNGQSVLPFLDAQGRQVGYGQGGVRANPDYSNPAYQVGYSPEAGAGARSMAQFGGRTAFNEPLTGQQYGGHKEFAGLAALQQGTNPFLNDPATAANLSLYQELSSPFQRADPNEYMAMARNINAGMPNTGEQAFQNAGRVAAGGTPDLTEMALRQAKLAQGGINYTESLRNNFGNQLLQDLTREGEKDLSRGIQDTQGSMAALGLGRSGQAQSVASGVWKDIQESNAAQRQGLLSQFAENAMTRQAQTSDLLRNTEMGNVANDI